MKQTKKYSQDQNTRRLLASEWAKEEIKVFERTGSYKSANENHQIAHGRNTYYDNNASSKFDIDTLLMYIN